jgi:hypothetical protein
MQNILTLGRFFANPTATRKLTGPPETVASQLKVTIIYLKQEPKGPLPLERWVAKIVAPAFSRRAPGPNPDFSQQS